MGGITGTRLYSVYVVIPAHNGDHIPCEDL